MAPERPTGARIQMLHSAAEVMDDIDRLFDRLLPVPHDPRAPLYEAMRYAASGASGCVRCWSVRPENCFTSSQRSLRRRGGQAMHVYSLIHDDHRRAWTMTPAPRKPITRRSTGDRGAGGHSLHALAFDGCAIRDSSDPFVRGELCCELARAAGRRAGGRPDDGSRQETSNFDPPTVTWL